ncbi:DNA repair protein XRCC1 [Palaemon carinicauda]|uniref:DNA repair protein XRCC1 n=1 Tax=Palaemon carinicauda TaxID=392227 RepID=UPI0035B62ED4
MPPLKFTEVLSFSSEDPNNPVDNLLSAETFRKWRCSQESCGKQATVTLKLERLTSIHSIDIGNNGAAFVEVLVAREGVDFQVLLVASSFMTPGESRNSSDMNRVRMFGPDKLNKNVAEQKWDRVKIICTQPFNKTLQFGLSFITVTATSEGSASSTPKVTKLGSFTLKDEEEEDSISVGSVFARRKEKDMASPLTGAAAIRAASASATSAASTSTPDAKKPKPANAPEMGFYQLKKPASPATERPKAPRPSTPSSSNGRDERDKERKREKDKDSDKHRDAEKHKERDKRNKDPESRNGKDREKTKKDKNDHRNSTSESNKKKKDSKDLQRTSSSSSSPSSSSSSKRKSAPFASLLKGVTFVLSGYQNPLRSQIRDMMVEMGARYKPDWDPSCTHLICAFANTPKYQQVKGKGKIVTAKWISDCHKNKIRYPWRRYALPKQDNAKESEDEIWAEELLPKEEKQKPASGSVDTDTEESIYEKESNEVYSDDEDTDDEIERLVCT